MPPSPDVWANRLDPAQKNLWFIDEVEARWQHLLAANPQLPQLTVRWCNHAQLEAAWDAIATFVGGRRGARRAGAHKDEQDVHLRASSACDLHHHTHGSANISDAVLAAADQAYVALMEWKS